MTLDVLLFASYADAAGSGTVRVTVADGATVGAVVEGVRAMLPTLQLPVRPLVAVNQRYAASAQVVHAGDEVAFIPPVSGG